MFAHNTKTSSQTDIVLTLTPHIVRVLDLTEQDLRPFRVSRDSLSPSSGDLPNFLLPPPPAAAPPPVAPPASPAPAPSTAAPIQVPGAR